MLLDYVQTDLNAEQVGDTLTMAGFELEGIEEVEGEAVLDIKVCSNRGDGLSILGLAREILAKVPTSKPTELYRRAGEGFPLPDDNQTLPADLVAIETEACDRFGVRRFEGDFQLETPSWIAKRLTQAGMRPISLLVDLSNYVMLEIGQPSHAYDFNTLKGGKLVARQAKAGEKLTTLDGKENDLQPYMMVIADAETPVGVAGVMGGLDTEVTPATSSVILEAAHFLNTSVRKTRRNLGFNTEASYRFERSVDPQGVPSALNRFAELLGQIDGGKSLVAGRLDVQTSVRETPVLNLRFSRANALLGMDVNPTDARRYLTSLGFAIEGDGDSVQVKVPSWRYDVTLEEDLIEDIGRVHGYEKIPETLPSGSTLVGGSKGAEKFIDRLRDLALGCGLTQTISHSLRGSSEFDDPAREMVGPRNPVPEMEWLRNSVLPGLVANSARNSGRSSALFELAKVFYKTEKGFGEEYELGLLLTHRAASLAHLTQGAPVAPDFYVLKGIFEEILAGVGVKDAEFKPSSDPRFHPRRSASVWIGTFNVGTFGDLHPSLINSANFNGVLIGGVLSPQALRSALATSNQELQMKAISRNPAVHRHMTVLVGLDVSWSSIDQAVKEALGEVVEEIWPFDSYRGKGIEDGKHALSFSIQLRKLGENFTDEEANQARDAALKALEPLGAVQR